MICPVRMSTALSSRPSRAIFHAILITSNMPSAPLAGQDVICHKTWAFLTGQTAMPECVLIAPPSAFHSSVGACLDAFMLVGTQVERMFRSHGAVRMETRLHL